MTDYDFDALEKAGDDDDNLVATLRAALKARNKDVKTLATAREETLAEKRAEAVKAAGLKEGVLRYIPKDVVTKDDLDLWLKSDEGAVFADARVTSNGQEQDPNAGATPDLPPAMLALFQQMAGVEAGGDQRQLVGQSQAAAGLASLQGKDLSEKDIMAAFAALDAGKVPGS